MKLELEEPFASSWKRGYLQKNREGRTIVCLFNSNKDRTTIAYARYLMSVKLGRLLEATEEVDHIDNDKSNDSIENLQLLSGAENRQKYIETIAHDQHGTNSMYRKGCRCAECVKWKSEYMKQYWDTHSEARDRRNKRKREKNKNHVPVV